MAGRVGRGQRDGVIGAPGRLSGRPPYPLPQVAMNRTSIGLVSRHRSGRADSPCILT